MHRWSFSKTPTRAILAIRPFVVNRGIIFMDDNTVRRVVVGGGRRGKIEVHGMDDRAGDTDRASLIKAWRNCCKIRKA